MVFSFLLRCKIFSFYGSCFVFLINVINQKMTCGFTSRSHESLIFCFCFLTLRWNGSGPSVATFPVAFLLFLSSPQGWVASWRLVLATVPLCYTPVTVTVTVESVCILWWVSLRVTPRSSSSLRQERRACGCPTSAIYFRSKVLSFPCCCIKFRNVFVVQ